MLYSGTDPKSYITEHTLVYEGNRLRRRVGAPQIAPISAGMATQQANLQLVNRVKRLGRDESTGKQGRSWVSTDE